MVVLTACELLMDARRFTEMLVGKWPSLGGTLVFCALTLPAQVSDDVASHDRNGDGVITREEWRGDRQAFRQRDQNRDGVLSGNEIPGYRRDRNNSRFGAADRRSDESSRLDRNESGLVEGYEWPYQKNVFHQLDRNQDSVLSPRELSDLNRIALQDLDKNRNRKIDADEWPGGFAQFERLDTNSDGKIAANEYFERGGEWQRRQRFDSWDTNRDGIIQSTEWKAENGMFHRLDTDGDSKVSWREFSGDKERYDRPYGWRQR